MSSEDRSVSVANTHGRLHLDETSIYQLVALVCTSERVSVTDLSIVLSDHATVHTLNKSYLNHDYETDVLSFPLNAPTDTDVIDGEIYVDLDTAEERCAEFDNSFQQEAFRYVIHGLLHLIGYEDSTAEEKATMKSREDFYLNAMAKL